VLVKSKLVLWFTSRYSESEFYKLVHVDIRRFALFIIAIADVSTRDQNNVVNVYFNQISWHIMAADDLVSFKNYFNNKKS
jgi:hypothetical protein